MKLRIIIEDDCSNYIYDGIFFDSERYKGNYQTASLAVPTMLDNTGIKLEALKISGLGNTNKNLKIKNLKDNENV